ncbi:MAG: U32 family peptidase [Planctomycetota bacterium]
MHFAQTRRESGRPRVHGDFSLNVTNSITARHLLACGADTLTASHDLDRRQLVQMLEHVPADRFTVVVHHHVLTFHTEHCVYSHLLSHGQDYRTCGRPCEQRQVSLEDRAGFEHPVVVDVGCRNTVFNAKAQSAAFLVPDLIRRSVGRLRVECVRETRTEAALVLAGYRALIAGELTAKELVRRIGAVEQYGVTRGTMAVQE